VGRGERFARSPNRAVGGHVGVEVGRVSEGLVADGALVGRGRAVGRLVFLQVGLLPETLVTDVAFEGTLARMDFLVSGEVGLGGKVFSTGIAHVFGLARMKMFHVGLLDKKIRIEIVGGAKKLPFSLYQTAEVTEISFAVTATEGFSGLAPVRTD